jgi:Tfp pilus assembly protein PilV
MVALAILGIGLLAMNGVFVMAMSTNNKNSKDTAATLLAQTVLEQIVAMGANNTATSFTITDCAATPNTFTVNVSGANAPGASLDSSGNIDWTASAVTGWDIANFTDCNTAPRQAQYEIRWNVTSLTTYTRRITVGARQKGGTQLGGMKYSVPVTLTTIGGS